MNTNETPLKAASRLNRIKAVSKVLRAIFLAALIVQVVGILASVVTIPIAVLTGIKSQIVFKNCSVGAALPFAFMVTLNFFRFFSRLKEGHLFDAQTVRHLEVAGKWWIVLGIIQIIFQSLEAYTFSPQNINISGSGVVAGLIVFFVAWVFREAQALQEEQELTV